MQGHFISMGAMVMRLEDIDFPIVRPVRTICEPEGGPCPTAVGRVDDVEDEQAGVVGIF